MKVIILIDEYADPFCSYTKCPVYQNWHMPKLTGRWYIENDILFLEILFTKVKGWLNRKERQKTSFVSEHGIKLILRGDIQTCSNKSQN